VSIFVDIALLGWIPLVLVIFSVVPPGRAVIASFLGAWMFLPMAGYDLPGLPDYTKTSVATYAVVVAIVLFDAGRLGKFRPSLLDLPMAVWCGVSFFSSVSAGYGAYDGLSALLSKIVDWGLPYLIGRLYLTDLKSMRDLAMGLFIGGLVYLPLCLFEIRMSPQLHVLVYGFHQHSFEQSIRGDAYRPTVFMQHGLAVGMFMCTSALAGFWLWRCKSVRSLYGVPMVWLVLAVAVVAVMCRSTGSTVLLLVGATVLAATRSLRTSVAAFLLMLAPIVYLFSRTVGGWSGQLLVDLASLISEFRAGSIATRLASESALWQAVQPRLLVGSGRFEFAGVRLEEGANAIIPDGMWLIALASNGLIGLAAFVAVLLAPPLAFLRKAPGKVWGSAAAAPAAAIAVCLALYMCDSLFNAMLNPVFVLAAGGLTSVVAASRRAPQVAKARPKEPRVSGAGFGSALTALHVRGRRSRGVPTR